MQLEQLLIHLQDLAPLETAESWDNVGLLVGDRRWNIQRVMTCLTLSATTLEECIESGANLVVCHHPIPFKPVARITDESLTGTLLLRAMSAGVAIYSPHTAWDNAKDGINQQLANALALTEIKPLQAFSNPRIKDPALGVGRSGVIHSATIGQIIETLQTKLPTLHPRYTHDLTRSVTKIGIVCGSGGSMLGLVAAQGCDGMLTGEATYHQCLEAEHHGIGLIMIGHHSSEAFAMIRFAELLQAKVGDVHVFASLREASLF